MLILDDKKIAFVHIPKTAGTTIRRVLSDHGANKAHEYPHPRAKHIKVREFVRSIPTYRDYFIFAIVRNPWDRMVSLWRYGTSDKDPHTPQAFETWLTTYAGTWGYNENIKYALNKESQGSWLTDDKGVYACNYVGRFEQLETDYSYVAVQYGLKLYDKLPFEKTTTHKHYSEYYTTKTRQWVRKYFADDIKDFKYHFEDN